MIQNSELSLQSLLGQEANIAAYFYNKTSSHHFRAQRTLLSKFIPHEVTNWREEQRAWRETAILFDQSHHMPELFLEGPDALSLLTKVGINRFDNFTPDRAKQFIACTPKGHVIGDCIAYSLGNDRYELVSGMPVLNWVQYQAEVGGFDVTIERDNPTPFNPAGRRINYRFQLEGPNAGQIFADAVTGEPPEIGFFRTATVDIAGCQVLVLRHGMAGHGGVEISGPYDDMETVRKAILDAGANHGIAAGGTLSYFSTIFANAWIAYPLPGIYTDDDLKAYREWLPATSWEANQQIGGSFYSENIEDYYLTPWDLGYGHIISFDHDFIGRAALEAIKEEPHRTKRTLVWNSDDVLKVIASQYGDGPRYKAIEYPTANIGFPHFDEIHSPEGERVGLSMHCGYSANERAMVSLATVGGAHAEIGSEVVVTWGEVSSNQWPRKDHVERHKQTQIRATVGSAPLNREELLKKSFGAGGAA